MNQKSPPKQSIAERAYSLWEQAGRPPGRDDEFWLRAEAELAAPARASNVPPIIRPSRPPAPSVATAPAHQIPPPLKNAVKTRRRGSKQA